MAITDLTGYTWRANSTLVSYLSYTTEGITYIYNDEEKTESFSGIRKISGIDAWHGTIAPFTYLLPTDGIYTAQSLTDGEGWYTSSPFVKVDTFEITFKAGDDLTNTELISWVEENGTLTPPQTTITLDLSTIGLSAGTHIIQMSLSDDGVTKIDSNLSNSVTYVVSL